MNKLEALCFQFKEKRLVFMYSTSKSQALQKNFIREFKKRVLLLYNETNNKHPENGWTRRLYLSPSSNMPMRVTFYVWNWGEMSLLFPPDSSNVRNKCCNWGSCRHITASKILMALFFFFFVRMLKIERKERRIRVAFGMWDRVECKLPQELCGK